MMKVGGEGAELTHWLGITAGWNGNEVAFLPAVDAGRIGFPLPYKPDINSLEVLPLNNTIARNPGPKSAEVLLSGDRDTPFRALIEVVSRRRGVAELSAALFEAQNAHALLIAVTIPGAPDSGPLARVAAPLLALLNDAEARVFLAHPQGRVAYPLELLDEPAFAEWLDQPIPGRVRVIQREDGFELQTAVGKLPGPDRNAPSIPIRGGRQDLSVLREAMTRLKQRFRTDQAWWRT